MSLMRHAWPWLGAGNRSGSQARTVQPDTYTREIGGVAPAPQFASIWIEAIEVAAETSEFRCQGSLQSRRRFGRGAAAQAKQVTGGTISRQSPDLRPLPWAAKRAHIRDFDLESKPSIPLQGGSHISPLLLNRSHRNELRTTDQSHLAEGNIWVKGPAAQARGSNQLKISPQPLRKPPLL